jgi:hypothetical protein
VSELVRVESVAVNQGHRAIGALNDVHGYFRPHARVILRPRKSDEEQAGQCA